MKYQLLLVDDSEEFSNLVHFALQPLVDRDELSLLFARDGVEALEMIASHPGIALVVTDISMPHMDGLTLLEQINTYNPHIRSIVISGYDDMNFVRRAMNAGASDYLVKPVNLDDLLHSIMRAAARVDIVREALKARDTLKAYESELRIAHEIQQEMLPRKFPAFPEYQEFDLDGGMLPARHVGGDFYDFMMIDDSHLGFVVGDVSGKGISAALLMAQVRILIRSYCLQGYTPAETLSLVNNIIADENKQAMFATVFLGIMHIATGEIVYCNAAHLNPLLLHTDGSASECEPTRNMAVGMLSGMPYHLGQTRLLPGESIIVLTDGVTEAQDKDGVQYGLDRLVLSTRGTVGMSAHDIMMNVVEHVHRFSSQSMQIDDIGIVVVKYLGTTKNQTVHSA